MMNAWTLPTSLCVGGEEWAIRSDFRAILDILKYFSDPEYEPDEKWEICLDILFPDYDIDNPPPMETIAEMRSQAVEFIDAGIKDDGRNRPRMMDWWQDAPIMATPISKILGKDVRSKEEIHWWTFLGAYMEIGSEQNVFSAVLGIREKLMKKVPQSKWQKWEKDYYKENKKLIDLKVNQVERSEEEKDELRALFGFKR